MLLMLSKLTRLTSSNNEDSSSRLSAFSDQAPGVSLTTES